jgi:hypothetical protein
MFKAMSAAVICSLTLSLTSSVFAAQDLSGFEKRFNFVKNEAGEVTYVKMNLVNSKFTILPYVRQVRDDIKSEIKRMQSKSSQAELEAFYDELYAGGDKSAEHAENVLAIRDSMENFKSVDIDKFFKRVETKSVLANFKKELQKALDKYSLANIASTQDPRYFYKRNVTYAVVTKALEFAKKQFGEVPLLNLASFVIVKVHDMVLEQRLFHQNMLLHYLENVSEADLGISAKDADKIFSSIYESRIGVLSYRESNAAAANWTRYGLDKFYSMVRGANNRLRRSSRTLSNVKRLNYAFFEAKVDGERVIQNLVSNKHKFSGKMAIAYYYEKPNKVKRFRSLLNLGELGLGFLPLPGWLKSQVESFIASYYVEQKRTEGALIGHFELNGNAVMAKSIKNQLINPYIKF